MPKSLTRVLLLAVFILLYIYWSGYGIGYFIGIKYAAWDVIDMRVVLALLEFLRWSVLGLLVLWFLQNNRKKA